MKFFFASFVFISMLLQTFNFGIIEANFYINQTNIEQSLCENKSKPELHCKGHCQLKKELEKQNEPQNASEVKEIKLFFDTSTLIQNLEKFRQEKNRFHNGNVNVARGYSIAFFHPPSI